MQLSTFRIQSEVQLSLHYQQRGGDDSDRLTLSDILLINSTRNYLNQLEINQSSPFITTSSCFLHLFIVCEISRFNENWLNQSPPTKVSLELVKIRCILFCTVIWFYLSSWLKPIQFIPSVPMSFKNAKQVKANLLKKNHNKTSKQKI